LKGGTPAKTSEGTVTIAPMAARPRVAAVMALARRFLLADRRPRDLLAGLGRGHRLDRLRPVLARHVVRPGDAEEGEQDHADSDDPPADDEPDQGHAMPTANRSARRCGRA
jgi:hypothetical protein